MASNGYASQLTSRIEQEYHRCGYTLGWRFLYSPASVLDGARIAFIGLNPGGNRVPTDHAEFAMRRGSAYVLESWEGPPGESRLQKQVRALFRRLGEPPEKILAGNLVPFRSPSWEKLPARDHALAFGKQIWRDVLARARPELVITMGSMPTTAVAEILAVTATQRIPVGWGRVSGSRAEYPDGVLVGIPHLSRFGIMTRRESQAALGKLLR